MAPKCLAGALMLLDQKGRMLDVGFSATRTAARRCHPAPLAEKKTAGKTGCWPHQQVLLVVAQGTAEVFEVGVDILFRNADGLGDVTHGALALAEEGENFLPDGLLANHGQMTSFGRSRKRQARRLARLIFPLSDRKETTKHRNSNHKNETANKLHKNFSVKEKSLLEKTQGGIDHLRVIGRAAFRGDFVYRLVQAEGGAVRPV